MLTLQQLLNTPTRPTISKGDMVTLTTHPEHGIYHRFVFEVVAISGDEALLHVVGADDSERIVTTAVNLLPYRDSVSEAKRRNKTRVARDIRRIYGIKHKIQ